MTMANAEHTIHICRHIFMCLRVCVGFILCFGRTFTSCEHLTRYILFRFDAFSQTFFALTRTYSLHFNSIKWKSLCVCVCACMCTLTHA